WRRASRWITTASFSHSARRAGHGCAPHSSESPPPSSTRASIPRRRPTGRARTRLRASSTSSPASTRRHSRGSSGRGAPFGAGPPCTTTSAVSAQSGGGARRPTPGGAGRCRRRRSEPDGDPPDVPADRAAGVALGRPPDRRLRVDRTAPEAAHTREDGEIGRAGGLHTTGDAGRARNSRRAPRLPRAADVVRDRLHQIRLGSERSLVAELLPELHHEAPLVQVAVAVEEERLDAALAAAVVRIRPDRDGGAVTVGLAGVDAERGHEQAGGHVEV